MHAPPPVLNPVTILRVALVLDGGPARVGVESSIVGRVDGAVAGYVAVSQSVADFTTRRFAVDPRRGERRRHALDRLSESGGIAKKRGDVTEQDARLREIGNIDDELLQILHVHLGRRARSVAKIRRRRDTVKPRRPASGRIARRQEVRL